jgi:hypothetical protein
MTTATLHQLGLDCPMLLESTAFAVLVELLKFTGTSPSVSFIRTCLDKLAADSTKTPEYHRWIKNMSQKYTKKIEQLRKSAMNLDQHTKLSSCLASRETAVNALMAKLETCVLKRQALPKALIEQINTLPKGRESILLVTTKASHYIHKWSYEDAEEINRSFMELLDAAETATTFLHHATNRCYPIVKSISNPSWTEKDSSTSVEALPSNAANAIADMICLHDILKLANADVVENK